MLVTPGELEELEREGIPLEEMLAPTGYVGDAAGHVRGVRFVRTALGEPDASGRRRPVPIPGSENVWPADNVILATGQFPDTSWIDASLRSQLVGDDGWLKSGRAVRTAHEKLFAAGDFAQGAMSLIDAIGHAKRCAREIDTFLCGTERWGELAVVEQAAYTGHAPSGNGTLRQAMPARPVAERRLTTEVETGFSAEAACAEATRCYLCCYLLELDSSRCIHCGACLDVKSADRCIVPAWGPRPPRRRACGANAGRVLPGAGPPGGQSRRVPALRLLCRRLSRRVLQHSQSHPPARAAACDET